jgi:uncharacterized protein (TIGR02266 family)
MPYEGHRDQKRIAKRISIRFGLTEPPSEMGFVKNLSRSGVAITAHRVHDPGQRLKLRIEDPREPIISDGVVRWRTDKSLARLGNAAMGVRFVGFNPSYSHLLDRLIEELEERRYEHRLDEAIKVVYESPERLLEEYTKNISAGGGFVASNEPLAVGRPVKLKLVVLDIAESFPVEGQIVHVVDLRTANLLGIDPGMGVQFVRWLDDSQTRFMNYIDELKAKHKVV